MKFSLSKHALERLNDRNIDEGTIRAVLNYPDSTVKESECKHNLPKNDPRRGHNIFIPRFCKYLQTT